MKIAVYGSLRKGAYNHSYLQDGMDYLETTTIEGYDLYSLGAYPAAVEGKGTLTIDLFEVDERTKNSIDLMEIGAGYYIEQIEVDGEEYDIYLYPEPPNDNLVEEGDWLNEM